MSDDTLNAGSDEELPAEAAIEPTEPAPEGITEEVDDKAEPKGKEKALRDTDLALKEAKAEYTKMRQEIAKMQGSMEMLAKLQASQKQEEAKDWMDDLNSEKVVEDPLAAIKLVTSNLRKEFASILSDRDAYLLSKVGKASIDPELQSRVDELKNDPDLADLPDEKLVVLARKIGAPQKKAVMQPRGNIAGSGRTVPVVKTKEGEFSAEQLAWLKASGVLKSGKRDDTLE